MDCLTAWRALEAFTEGKALRSGPEGRADFHRQRGREAERVFKAEILLRTKVVGLVVMAVTEQDTSL